jgi:hypothetical protein
VSEGKEMRGGSDPEGRDCAKTRCIRHHGRDRNCRCAARLRKRRNVAGADTVAILPAALVVHPLMVAFVACHLGGLGGFCGRTGVRQLEPGACDPGTQQDGERGQDWPKTG